MCCPTALPRSIPRLTWPDSAATVSNPYFATTDPTYGITTSQYDALDRVTQTTKQDGSISTVLRLQQLRAIARICTTSADEAGKLRRGLL